MSQELLLHLHSRLPYAKMESCSSFLCMCRCLMVQQVRDLRSPSTPYPSPHRDQELVGSPGEEGLAEEEGYWSIHKWWGPTGLC